MKIEPKQNAKRPKYAAALAALAAATLLTGCRNEKSVQIAGLIPVVEDTSDAGAQTAPAE